MHTRRLVADHIPGHGDAAARIVNARAGPASIPEPKRAVARLRPEKPADWRRGTEAGDGLKFHRNRTLHAAAQISFDWVVHQDKKLNLSTGDILNEQ